MSTFSWISRIRWNPLLFLHVSVGILPFYYLCLACIVCVILFKTSKSLHECILSLAIPVSCVWIDVPLSRNLLYLVLGAVMSKEPSFQLCSMNTNSCFKLCYTTESCFKLSVVRTAVLTQSFNEAASLYIYVHIYRNLLIL